MSELLSQRVVNGMTAVDAIQFDLDSEAERGWIEVRVKDRPEKGRWKVRLVRDPHRADMGWLLLEGVFHWRLMDARQLLSSPHLYVPSNIGPTPERVAIWADLLVNPFPPSPAVGDGKEEG